MSLLDKLTIQPFLNETAKEIHQANVEKGFYDDYRSMQEAVGFKNEDLLPALETTFDAQRIALIQSEASEALEANRKNKTIRHQTHFDEASKRTVFEISDENFKILFEGVVKDTEEDEIADTLIRLFDYAGFKGIDLDFHVKAKLKYNALRPHKHGKSF